MIITADTTTTRTDQHPVPIGDQARAAESAIEAVTTAGRVAAITALRNNPQSHHSPAPAYWASLVNDGIRLAIDLDVESEPEPSVDGATAPGRADLIIAAVPPSWSGHRRIDQLALQAARQLRTGGILAVLTHSDRNEAQLVDPTGPVVTAAQNADLLYLQHIVALHHNIDTSAEREPLDTDAPVADLPQPHTRVHSDVLVFAQPHDHEPPPASGIPATTPTSVIR